MKIKPCTKFCVLLMRSHEVIKLQSFEPGVSDAIPANVQNILSLISYVYFC